MWPNFLRWKQVLLYRGWSQDSDALWLLPVHQTSVRSRAISSSLVNGDDEAEGVEFLEAAAASSMRFWEEASSLRYLSRSMTKSVMPSWCMTEMSSTRSQVCTSRAICLTVGAMAFWVVNGEFMITPRHSTCR